MAASSILTPSQSGTFGEGDRKVLKTRVHVIGHYLREPGAPPLGPEAAATFVERALSGKARLRTHLTLFGSGIRLGERGPFAALPLEFIAYGRVSDLVSSGAHPAVLVVGVRHYEQRCVRVLQFKDDVCLRVVVDVIERHRQALEDDVARMSDLQSLSSGMRLSARGGDSGGGENRNWRLLSSRPAVDAANGSAAVESVDGDTRRSRWSSAAVAEDEGDYAVIRRSVMAPRVEQPSPAPALRLPTSTVAAKAAARGVGDGSGCESPVERGQEQHLYQKNPHLQAQNSLSHWSAARVGGGSVRASVTDAANFEEVETAAIFETPDGPPTLLNELVQRNGGSDNGGGGGDRAAREDGDRRWATELPPEFVARVRVTHGRPADWTTTLEDRAGED